MRLGSRMLYIEAIIQGKGDYDCLDTGRAIQVRHIKSKIAFKAKLSLLPVNMTRFHSIT